MAAQVFWTIHPAIAAGLVVVVFALAWSIALAVRRVLHHSLAAAEVIDPEIRAMVSFRPLNLLHDFSQLGTFDIIFCRNVLIYFDQETKIGVLKRMAHSVERDGYLVLGASETVVGLTDSFKPFADLRGLYTPNQNAKFTVYPPGQAHDKPVGSSPSGLPLQVPAGTWDALVEYQPPAGQQRHEPAGP